MKNMGYRVRRDSVEEVEALFELSSEVRFRIAWGFGCKGEQLEHMLQGRRTRPGSDHAGLCKDVHLFQKSHWKLHF